MIIQGWKLGAGSWKLEVGSWKLAHSRRPTTDNRQPTTDVDDRRYVYIYIYTYIYVCVCPSPRVCGSWVGSWELGAGSWKLAHSRRPTTDNRQPTTDVDDVRWNPSTTSTSLSVLFLSLSCPSLDRISLTF